MILLRWNAKFKKRLAQYLKKYPQKKELIKEKLATFSKNPYSYELRNHKLSGKLNESRAISVDYDCRIVFTELNEREVFLIDIGSHDEVY